MKTNLLTLVITLTLGVILAGSLLMPAVTDAQRTAGEEVHFDNIQSGYTYRLTEKTETVSITITGSNGNIYYNGEAITDDGFALFTDTVAIRADATNKNLFVSTPTASNEYRISWNSNYSFVFDNGICTITDVGNSTVTATIPYTWMFSPADEGEWVTVTGSSTHYVNSINDIVASGYYSTGDNDTGYCVKDGIATVTEDFTTKANFTLTPVSGTTDAFTATMTIDVGDENFTPWFMLIKRDIVGHEASGAAYSLYGAIPIIVIAGLVLAGASAILVRNRD